MSGVHEVFSLFELELQNVQRLFLDELPEGSSFSECVEKFESSVTMIGDFFDDFLLRPFVGDAG